MTFLSADLPDEDPALRRWLEERLVSSDLGQLAAELAAIGEAPLPAPALEEVLAGQRAAVLSGGLQVLPRAGLRQLLLHPTLLLELQEMVLIEGGDYWERQLQAQPAPAELQRALDQFQDRMAGREAGPGTLRYPWYRRPWLVSLLSAAAVLVVVLPWALFLQRPAAPSAAAGWGWARSGALPSDLSADAYLRALADRAAEWFNKRPDQPEEVSRRIAEFRQGCSVLIFAEHRPLAEEDRQWLRERCRAWATRLDKLRAEVEAGRDPLQVRGEADQTVEKLITALQARSREVGARG